MGGMSIETKNVDKWCAFFRSSNTDIFEIIKNAIVFAASNYPDEFKLKREGITEILFSKKLNHFLCSEDQVELSPVNKGTVKVRTYHEVDMKEKQALSDTIDDEIMIRITGGSSNKEEILRKSTKGEGKSVLSKLVQKVKEFDDYTIDGIKAASIGLLLYELNTLGSEQIRLLARSLVHRFIHMIDLSSATKEYDEEKATRTDKIEHVRKTEATQEKKGFDQDGPTFVSSTLKAEGSTNGEKNAKNFKLITEEEAITKPKCVDDTTTIFEDSIKRLRDNYQEAENAKKRKRIQVVEFQQPPKKACLKRKGFINREMFRCLQV